MKITIAATALAAAAVCLLSTACSSSSSSNPSAPGTGAGAGAHSSPSAVAAAHGSSASTGGSAATCKQLSFADVQPLIIEKVVSVKTTPITADGHGEQCAFVAKSTGSTGSIIVQVLSGSQGSMAYAQGVGAEDEPVVVPGVGDKASRDTERGDVTALKGDLYCSASYGTSDDIPGVGPLEEAHGATNNIGEKYYDAVAKAMGTLCNRIYGSGDTKVDLSSLLAADATATPSDDGGLPSTITFPTDAATS